MTDAREKGFVRSTSGFLWLGNTVVETTGMPLCCCCDTLFFCFLFSPSMFLTVVVAVTLLTRKKGVLLLFFVYFSVQGCVFFTS